MTIIQIKRSSGAAAPIIADLEEGELAYSEDRTGNGGAAKLYIESVNSAGTAVIDTIGGKYYTTAVDAATDANTASTIVKRDASGNFTAGTITAALSGNATTATALATARAIAVSGAVTGTANFDGSAGISIATTLDSESVQDLVAPMLTGGSHSNISFAYDDTNGVINATVTDATNSFKTISVSGQTDVVADSSTDTLTLATGTGVSITTTPLSDTITFTNTGVTSAVAGTGISVSGATGAVTFANTGVTEITGTADQVVASGSTGSITLSLPQSINTTSSPSFAAVTTSGNAAINGGTITTTATSAALFSTNATTIAIGSGTSTVNVGNHLTVAGNLTVNGSVTTINSTTISVDDKNIELASVVTPTDTTADGAGITVKGASDKTFNWVNATAAWTSSEHLDIASGKSFKVAGTNVLSATALGSGVVASSLTSVGTLSSGTWNASTIAVSYGGTGKTSVTANALLYGAGTGAMVEVTGTSGQVLQMNSSGVPTFGNVDGGTY